VCESSGPKEALNKSGSSRLCSQCVETRRGSHGIVVLLRRSATLDPRIVNARSRAMTCSEVP